MLMPSDTPRDSHSCVFTKPSFFPAGGALSMSMGVLLCTLALFPGCGKSDTSIPPDNSLPPPPAGQGLQYTMSSTIAGGTEIERCHFFTAPPEGFNVNHDQVRFTAGSHHVLLYMTNYTSIPTTDRRGGQHDTSGTFDCADGATADWETTGILSGAQSTAADSMVNLPQGVAIKVAGGAVLLMNTHYLNANPNAVDTAAYINLYTVPTEQVNTEGGVILFYNPFIQVPAMAKASARMRCPLPQDINLSTIQSHMHRLGIGYVATWLDEKGMPIEDLYTNDQWANVPVKTFTPGMALRAGTTIDYHCDYQNTQQHNVDQGFSVNDEMCVLIGSYYPRVPRFESCAQATYVGSGAVNSADTLTCLASAMGTGNTDALYGCIVSSCPAIAGPLTDTLNCLFSQGNGMCQSSCTGSSSQCQACIQNACQGQIGTLTQASC